MKNSEIKTKQEKMYISCLEMLNGSMERMKEKINKAIKSGAVDIASWDENDYFLPKAIIMAVLRNQSEQYMPFSKEKTKKINKEISNINYFI